MPTKSRRLSRREKRLVAEKLSRPQPAAAIAKQKEVNEGNRARIEAAGQAIFDEDGSWPTLELVLGKDKHIRKATLDRNSDALDPVRLKWEAKNGERADWRRRREKREMAQRIGSAARAADTPRMQDDRSPDAVSAAEAQLRRQLERVTRELATEKASHADTRGRAVHEQEQRRRATLGVIKQHAAFMDEARPNKKS